MFAFIAVIVKGETPLVRPLISLEKSFAGCVLRTLNPVGWRAETPALPDFPCSTARDPGPDIEALNRCIRLTSPAPRRLLIGQVQIFLAFYGRLI